MSPPAEGPISEAEPRGAASGEARTRRLCLVALALVLPLTFLFLSRESLSGWVRGRGLFAREVAVGSSAAYMGHEWKLDTFKVITGGDPRLVMPAGRAFVLVRLAVDIRKDVGAEWTGCELSLVDDEGRKWLPLFLLLSSDLEKLIEPDGHSAPSCGSVSLSKPKAGAHVLVEEKYVVPRQGLERLRPAFGAAGGRPYYLRFEAPRSEPP